MRRPSNYGWPVCYKPDLPMYEWDFNTQTTLGTTFECGNPAHGPENASRWNTGRTVTPPITAPDVWYSFRDDLWGTPCFDGYNRSPVQPCPLIFPELGQGGVGPHGATKYEYDPDNPSETKFPPYYDGAVFFAEWTRDYLKEIRLDSDGNVLKINDLLNCGAALATTPFPFECETRWTSSSAPTGTTTCSPTATASSRPTPMRACTGGSTSRARSGRRPCSTRTRPVAPRR